MTRRLEAECPGHAEVDEERRSALETYDEVLPAPLDCGDSLAFELGDDLPGVVRARQPKIEDLDARERLSLEPRGQLAANRLDLGQLGHGATR